MPDGFYSTGDFFISRKDFDADDEDRFASERL